MPLAAFRVVQAYFEGFLTLSKILQHGTSVFASRPKEVVLRIFIALLRAINIALG
jgi:hypothetical protein